ncbi:MAG: O-antigen ligase family protein [Acidobacteriota bacterium]
MQADGLGRSRARYHKRGWSREYNGFPVARDRHDSAVWGLYLAASGVIYSITAMESLVALAGLVWVGTAVFRPGRAARPHVPLLVLFLALAAWSLASAILSPEPGLSLNDSLSMLLWVVAPMGTALLTPARARRVRELLLLQAGFLGAWAVLEYVFWWDGQPLLRVRGPYSHHMTLAGVLVVTTLQGLPRPDLGGLFGRRVGSAAGRLAAGLGLMGMMATLTRSALLSVGAGLAVLCLTGSRARRHRRLKVSLAGGGLLLLSLLVTLPFMPSTGGSQPGTAAQASITDRLVLWRAGWRMISDHPFFGVGPHRVRRVAAEYLPPGYVRPGPPSHLHSAGLNLAAERGWPALLLAGLLYGAVLFPRPREGGGRDDPSGRGARAAVVAFLVMGLFENNFDDVEVLFVHLLTLATLVAASWPPACARAPHPEEGGTQSGQGRQLTRSEGHLAAGVDPS